MIFVGWLISFTVATTVLTPPLLRQLVILDERSKLQALSLELCQIPAEGIPARLEQLQPEQIELMAVGASYQGGLAEQTIPGSGFILVSFRPTSWSEARKVMQPSLPRWLGALALNFAFLYLLVTLLSRFVTRPLDHLKLALNSFGQGERGVSVPLPKEEELAQLAAAFNTMVEQLESREADLAQTTQQLEEALRAKERVFANTNHELRTPLTAILGYVQMLEEGLKGPVSAEQGQCLEVIERNARALLSQVEDLLTLSRLQSGSFPLKLESCDIRDLVQELLLDFQPAYLQKGIELTAALPETAVESLFDLERGRQILANLLDNARKFSTEGKVTISVDQGGVEVSDQGPGVESEDTLFQEFARGPSSEGVEGAGLGLALARQLARGMGGDLRLLKTGVDGSTFRWDLRVAP